MILVVMVLDDVSHLHGVLEAWQRAGVGGITILESTGVNRVLTRNQPRSMFMGFGAFGAGRVGHNTLFSVVPEEAVVEAVVRETEAVLGSLDEPHRGILFTLPVAKTWGINN